MKKIVLTFAAVAAAFAGCANPGIVKMSPDTYMLTRTDKGGIFGNASAMKADVIREATTFAEQQGKVAIPLSTKETPMRPGQFASFEYQFRVVDPHDPEARRTSLTPRADVVIEKIEKVDANLKTKDETPKAKDVYAELVKLDELRKRGILTEAEFEEQKRKLLAGN